MADRFSRGMRRQEVSRPSIRPALPQVAPAPNMTQMGVAPPTLRSALQGDLRTSDLPTNALVQQLRQLEADRRMSPMGEKYQMRAAVMPQQPMSGSFPALPATYDEYMRNFMEQSRINSMTPGAPQIMPMSYEGFMQRRQALGVPQQTFSAPPYVPPQQPMPAGAVGMQPSGLFGGQSPTQMQAQPSFQPSYSPRGFGPTDGGFRPLDPNNPRLVNPMQQPAASGPNFSGNWASAGNASQQANPFNQGIGSIGPSRTDTFNKFGGPFGGM